MNHVVLLGDSIFDNAAYVAGGPDVRTQLQDLLPHDWRVTRLAVDGHRTADVAGQLQRLSADASHLVVSVCGNDALDHLDFLSQAAQSVADVLGRLSTIAEGFERAYHQRLQAVLQHGLPTVLCTIDDPRFPEQEGQRLAITALTVFNDAIIREAFKAGVPSSTCGSSVMPRLTMRTRWSRRWRVGRRLRRPWRGWYRSIIVIAVAPVSTSDKRHHETDARAIPPPI